MAMLGKALILATLCVSVARGYQFMANCVPSITVATFVGSGGVIGKYSTILQHLLPTTYGDLVAVAAGERDLDCLAAENAINENRMVLHDVPDKYNMTVLDPSEEAQLANLSKSYLYVFRMAKFSPNRFISVCPSGTIVGMLNQTGGSVALYAPALQIMMPRLYCGVKYIGQSQTALDCMVASNLINRANNTVLHLLKQSKFAGVKEVGFFGGIKKGNVNLTYLYVFENCMWNKTTRSTLSWV
ncbi:unnamed protein product [Polarella glacialis]|uniref:Uncharacterized protein n=1 Tax=Polarella glacialis TaxID=89957 RepID=A0A813F562_POLGL|nr:unnamed protein product [Polarella glacialis]